MEIAFKKKWFHYGFFAALNQVCVRISFALQKNKIDKVTETA
jgi:hypothetical protein